MLVVVLGWVLFDFTRLADMGAYFGDLFSWRNGLVSADAFATLMTHLPLFALAVVFSLPTARRAFEAWKNKRFWRVLEPVLGVLALVLCIACLVSSTYNPFLYFRF
jgi:alginate O-acetyltransferase complex protein AlgI